MILTTPAISPFRYYTVALINGLFSLTPVIYHLNINKNLYPALSSNLFILFVTLGSILVGKLYVELSLFFEAYHIDGKVQETYPSEESYSQEAEQFWERSHIHYWYAFLLRNTDPNDQKMIADKVIGFIVERMIFWTSFMFSLIAFSILLLIFFGCQMDLPEILLTILSLIFLEYVLYRRVMHLAESLSFLRYLIMDPNNPFFR